MAAIETTQGGLSALLARPGIRQFVKFCLVGATSTVIDFGVYLGLIEWLHLANWVGGTFGIADAGHALAVARPIALTIGFLFAVTNGYIWNSRWTFRGAESDGVSDRKRYAKFVATNVIGWLLSQAILNTVAHTAPDAVLAPIRSVTHLQDPAGFLGKLIAVGVVVSWNFLASKYWTFRK